MTDSSAFAAPGTPPPPLPSPLRRRLIDFPHRFIAAPMVGQSDLPFRLMCRKNGADVCYTAMLLSDRFAVDPSYRLQHFHTIPSDRPLIAQFAGHDPSLLFTAASRISHLVDCVDLNLGCPQSCAQTGLYGAFLLDRPHWPLIRRLIHSLLPLGVAVSVKVRLLPTLPLTLSFLSYLCDSGVSAIAIHGHQRGSSKRRREGAANLEWMTACVRHVKAYAKEVTVWVNGNVRGYGDVRANLSTTGADGILVGEALLCNPRLFAPSYVNLHPHALEALPPLWREVRGKGGEGEGMGVEALEVAREYLDWVEKVGGVEWSAVGYHIWNILRWTVIWDEAIAVQVKGELRQQVQGIAELREWMERWGKVSQCELDRRAAAAHSPLPRERFLSTSWWTGVAEEEDRAPTPPGGESDDRGLVDFSCLCGD